jgi:hypothetical protein
MSENPPSGPLHGHGATGFPSAPTPTGFHPAPSGPPAWQPAPVRGQSRGLTYVALAIAVIATGLAIVGWFRPVAPAPQAHAAAPTYTEQQISDAKQSACDAFEVVQKGAALQTNPPQSDDPAMSNAQAAHAQLSLVAGAGYLRDHVGPATSTPIADELHKLANTMLDIGINALAGAKNADPAQATRIKDANDAVDRTVELCK